VCVCVCACIVCIYVYMYICIYVDLGFYVHMCRNLCFNLDVAYRPRVYAPWDCLMKCLTAIPRSLPRHSP